MEAVQKIMHGHFKVMQGQKIQTNQNKPKQKKGWVIEWPQDKTVS